MADDLKALLRLERFSLPHLSGNHVTWGIIGGGFLAGILCGACFFFDGTGAPATDEAQSALPVTSTVPPSAPRIAPVAVDSAETSVELAAERVRLQRELEAETLRLEVEALRRQLVELKSSPVSVEAPRELPSRGHTPGLAGAATRSVSAPSAAEVRPVAPGEATLASWNKMNAIILQEAALRSAPSGGITASNAAGFLDARIQAAEFAVDALRQLDTSGVDPRVTQLAEQLAGWYTDGRQVAEAGKGLLSGASVQERQGSAGKKYQAAERSHSQSVNAINAAGEQVRGEMSRKYGLTFPPLN